MMELVYHANLDTPEAVEVFCTQMVNNYRSSLAKNRQFYTKA